MPKSSRHLLIITLSATMLAAALTACSSTEKPAAASQEPSTQSPAPAPTPTPSPDPGSTAPQTSGQDVKGAASGSTNVQSSGKPPQVNGTQAYVLQIMEQAKKGKVPGFDYAAHKSLIDQVEEDWGKPDQKDTAGSGIYSTYGKHKAAFGFNKGSLIFDVRSYDSKLHELGFSQIKSALGQPDDTIANKTETIYVYQANDQFQLKFIIPSSTGKVDHISVFSPQDAKNLMAG
ncbi:YjgB family protein [Paenibacillus sp. 32352]|uniref:YjgB family protein n=1 Tax=Paenibacillus sp. 32352 TaxID=1969111 RepID=UPI0009ABCC66|nr:YjgB family protein [Paenibacillus sp. 32352]